MRTMPSLFPLAALLVLASPTHAQRLDSAAIFGSEWSANVIVRATDSGSEAHAVKGIVEAFWLAPGRFVYIAALAKGNDRALLGWVNGKTTLLATHGDAFPVGTERVRIGLREGVQRSTFVIGRELYATLAPGGAIRGRQLNVYATDGETWRPFVKRGDTLRTRRGLVRVNGAEIAGILERDPVIQFWSDQGFGLVRLSESGPQTLLLQHDTLPDGTVATYGWELFPGRFRAAAGSWSAVLVQKSRDLLIVPGPQGPRLALSSVDRVPGDSSREVGKLQAFPVGPDASLVWGGPQRNKNVMLLGGADAWRVIMPHQDSLRERNGRYYLFRDFHPLGENSGLVSILYANDYYPVTGMPVNPTFGDVYLIDRGKLSPVPWESELGLTTKQAREKWAGPGGGFSTVGEIAFRSIPGYDRGVIISLPFMTVSEVGGRKEFRPRDLYFDTQRRQVAPMPMLRLSGGGTVPISDVIGWNSDDEVVARVGHDLALLRRRR